MGPGGDRPSVNYIEQILTDDGMRTNVYISNGFEEMVTLFHILISAGEKDRIFIHLNCGLFSMDAQLLISAMELTKAKVTVGVGIAEGFYSAVLIAKAHVVQLQPMSSLIITWPRDYFVLRGLSNVDTQVNYFKASIARYVNILISSGLCTEEEMDIINVNKKLKLFNRSDLAERLSNVEQ